MLVFTDSPMHERSSGPSLPEQPADIPMHERSPERITKQCTAEPDIQQGDHDMPEIYHFHVKGRHYVRCFFCTKFPDTVKLHARKGKLPPMAQGSGTIFREPVVAAHLKTRYHQEAKKAFRLSSLSNIEISQASQIGKYISKANEELCNRIGSLMLQVYNDAKKLTLSAFSFPSRVVVSDIAHAFRMSETGLKNVSKSDLQYVTPQNHREFLNCIVSSYKETLTKQILEQTMALSLRCDGSVDRTQVDKIFVMAKAVTNIGEETQYFLGAAEPQQRGASGLLGAVCEACSNVLSENRSTDLFAQMSSLVTDGASANTGDKKGLWTIMEKMRAENSTMTVSPVIKIWCSAHRANLAWKAVGDTVPELKNVFSQLTGLSSFFHSSGLRTRELRAVAAANNLRLLTLPKTFEVRWTAFTMELVNSVLVSWHAMVLFLQSSTEKAAKGYLNFLTNLQNLKLLAVITDILTVFTRYHKLLQSDTTTILDVDKFTSNVKSQLLKLKEVPLLGGWKETLKEEIKETDEGVVLLKDVVLNVSNRRLGEHHKFVSDKREFFAVENEIISALVEFLTQRFSVDEERLSIAKDFTDLLPAADLRSVHNVFCSDLSLESLSLEYHDLMSMEKTQLQALRKLNLSAKVKHLAQSQHYKTLNMVLARILAAKPHSADVERLISCSNILKSPGRAKMQLDTENLYLFVHYNMPPLSQWEPREAILNWLKNKPHRSTSRPKAKEQRYFNGMFPQHQLNDESDSDELSTQALSTKKKCF